ncbi:MAG: xylann 1,4-beta-xylosidase, partial [Clostridia bacterium]|nr:xylann 1,4-beta-xylosidase [Clostridia bacterium]
MIHIDFCSEGQRYKPYWKTCVGAGRANEGLRAAFQRQLRQVQEQIGFRYLRFHGLLHDDMFVVRENESGEIIYNFQYIDELFDSMLEMQIRPFVELSFFPSCLKGGDATQFWWKANITPPETWDGWCALIDRLIRHSLQRYGEAEVRTWYFEVWNEPNLNSFWDGTRSQYFSLYAATAQTIKSIDPHLRVGGPATSNFVPDDRFDGETEDFTHHLTHKVDDLDNLHWHGVWIEAFLDYCAKHHLPLDFVSTHPYPTDFAFDQTGRMKGRTRNVDSTRQDMLWLKQTVQRSAYPNAEIHLTEWSSSPSSRDCTHDYLQEAAYLVKCNLDGIGLADSLSFWAFTDVFEETGAGDSIFHGGFGLINYQGIVKPSFHAYRMLSRLGDTLLYRDEHAFFTKKEGKLAALLYHYPLSSTVSMSPY